MIMSYEDLFSFDGSKTISEGSVEQQSDPLFNSEEPDLTEETTDVFDGLEIDCRSELSSPSPSDSDSKTSDPHEKPVKKKLVIGKHIKTNEDGSHKYTCTICNCSFSRKQQIRYHDYCVTGNRPLKCDLCGKGFIKKSHLLYHVRTHTGESPYKCPICQKGFKQKTKLNRHKKTHESDSRLVCHFCNKSYSDKDSLRKHEQKHRENVFNCPTCKKSYSDKFTLKQHLVTHQSPKYVCDVCGKSFHRRNSLNIHKQIHDDIYPFECGNCRRTFRNKKELKHHSIVHDKNNPGHECDICNITCGRRDNLLRHIRNCHLDPYDNNAQTSCKTGSTKNTAVNADKMTGSSNKVVSESNVAHHSCNTVETQENNRSVTNVCNDTLNSNNYCEKDSTIVKMHHGQNTNILRENSSDFKVSNEGENNVFLPQNVIQTVPHPSEIGNHSLTGKHVNISLVSTGNKPHSFPNGIVSDNDPCGISHQDIIDRHENNPGPTQKISVIKHTDLYKEAIIQANLCREPVIKTSSRDKNK